MTAVTDRQTSTHGMGLGLCGNGGSAVSMFGEVGRSKPGWQRVGSRRVHGMRLGLCHCVIMAQ